MQQKKDTIYALSTCYGKSGVAIIRVSGPESLRVLKDVNFKQNIEPRIATLGKIYDAFTADVIDEAIIIYFPKDNSYTGEDVVEFQVHGGIAIINKILLMFNSLEYMRLANNGEFTRIALENNRISLPRAESLIELINSETEYQRKIAIRHYNGDLEDVYLNWRKQLVKLLSTTEAYIDFPDDMLGQEELSALNQEIDSLNCELRRSIESFSKANTLMNGINISIVGETNVGKSTLMNMLSRADSSIISDIAGTTRDVVKTKIELLGVPIILQDTAGIRSTHDEIEKLGIEKSKQAMRNGDIIIIILDISNLSDLSILYQVKEFQKDDVATIFLLNKIDKVQNYLRLESTVIDYLSSINFTYQRLISVSLKLNDDYLKIIESIELLIKDHLPSSSSNLVTNIRHQDSLNHCSDYLQKALAIDVLELKAEELKCAAKEIGGLLGDINMEEVLDEIFSSFCIGK